MNEKKKILCEFQVKRKDVYDIRPKEKDCGEPASRVRCSGELTSLIMNLCEAHRLHVTREYEWKVTNLEESNG
jgi:hypothetical protein